MEAVSVVHLSTLPYLLQAIQLALVLGCIVLNHTVMAFERFFPKHLAYMSLITYIDPTSWKHPCINEEKEFDHDTVTEPKTVAKREFGIAREEIGSVMSNLGIFLSQEDDQVKDYMSDEEFSALFEQMEPGLQEVKDAFLIFDQNGDGFIDAKELQTVLIRLGLREGASLDACQSMIERHDRNHDGMIDQSDFYKLLESSLL